MKASFENFSSEDWSGASACPSGLGSKRRQRNWRSLSHWTIGLGLGLANAVLIAVPSQAAERVTFSYGAIERSVSVESLAIYANEGRLTEELRPYTRYFDDDTLVQIRALLTERLDFDVVAVAQFLYTDQGEYLLAQAGDIVRTGSRLPGDRALRGALILAAAEGIGGLSVLNVLRYFPTESLRIDLSKGLVIARQINQTLSQSEAALQLVEQLAAEQVAQEVAQNPVPEPEPAVVSPLLTGQLIPQIGPYSVERRSYFLKASQAPVDVYLPAFESPQSPLLARPAIVISHGLGSDRTSYGYLAQYLTSYGFVVINVEHPGSSAVQIQSLLTGRATQVVPDDEFVRRPVMISALLDELEQRSRQDLKLASLIDFQQIGVIGQSFGAYTALALAGAPINFGLLQMDCPPADFSINLSLLLQCQALAVAPADLGSQDLSDSRVKAAIAVNPISSQLFGEASLSQIQIPTMLIAGSADTIAPALPEQIEPFSWLTTPDRYLLLMQGATHFSTIGPTETGSEAFLLPPTVLGPAPPVAQAYLQVMSLAFFETYLDNRLDYQALLTSRFAARLSQPDIPLSLIRALTESQLDRRLDASTD